MMEGISDELKGKCERAFRGYEMKIWLWRVVAKQQKQEMAENRDYR